jgi:proteasome lid subunit RPN8/RPN11
VELTYLVVAYTASGVSSVREVVLTVPSHGVAVFNFGEGLTRVARLSLGLGELPDSSWAPSASVAFFETAGSPEPLMFFGEALDLTGAVSGVVHRGPQGPAWMSSYDDIRALADYVGPVVLRRPHEDACAVSASVSFGRAVAGLVSVSVTWRRGRGPDGLVI